VGDIGGTGLATVLVTDLLDTAAAGPRPEYARTAGSAALRDWRPEDAVESFGGLAVGSFDHTAIAVFGPPARAVRCALAIRAEAAARGLRVRVGLHTGEVERSGDQLGGQAVAVARGICAVAGYGDILLSAPTRDIGLGDGVATADRGVHQLRGLPGHWQLHAVIDDVDAGDREQPGFDAPGTTGPHVLIVDDHPLWRGTLRTIVEHGLVAGVVVEAATADEAVSAAAACRPDVIVMDIDLSGSSGIEATRRILASDPGARVLILSSSQEQPQVTEAVHAGARGYVLKTSRAGEIVSSIRTVAVGGLAFPPELADAVLQALRMPPGQLPADAAVTVVAASAIDREGITQLLTRAGVKLTDPAATPFDLAESAVKGPRVILAVDPPAASGDRLVELASQPGTAVLIVGDQTHPRLAELLGRRHGGGQLTRRLASAEDLVAAVRRVAAGEVVLHPDAAEALVSGASADAVASLSDRELAVLRRMAAGDSNSGIGERLYLSPKTVETHVGAIFAKLGLEPAAESHRRVRAVLAYQRSPLAGADVEG
jgi:DNA-binding NarL/FixJ family response regulator/class 3 adenylate cyclase